MSIYLSTTTRRHLAFIAAAWCCNFSGLRVCHSDQQTSDVGAAECEVTVGTSRKLWTQSRSASGQLAGEGVLALSMAGADVRAAARAFARACACAHARARILCAA